ncbi:MAG TPA: hypothetical protein VH853_20270 [Polyangia bacterium]|jgi:hypothetical protein|nr:hypothetical protein [Polyangia bacterium]
MDDQPSLPEDRFNALLGRALSREDRDRLAKVRNALGIRANDAVWDVMIALDYHRQLYSAVPKQLAAERAKLVAEVGALLESVGGRQNRAPKVGAPRGGGKSPVWPSCGQAALLAAAAVAFGAICIAAGWAMAGRGRQPWGAAGPLGAVLAAPAGWLIFLLLLPAAVAWARTGWAAARWNEDLRVRAVGWLLLATSIGLVAAALAVLAVALPQ